MVHDLAVIGGGPGGYATAFRAAARGLDVALIEQDRLGGTCLNQGCIPSKATLFVAEVIEQVQRAEELGLDLTYRGLHGDNLQAFRASVVDRMRAGLEALVEARTSLYRGRGRIVAAAGPTKAVEVTTDSGRIGTVESRHLVVATGSSPRVLSGVAADGRIVQTSDQALWSTAAPRRAVVIGGGAIGMEFASMWAPMGTDVTIIEALDHVLPLEDPDVSTAVERAYRRNGIDVLTGSRVLEVKTGTESAVVRVDARGTDGGFEADVILVAVGRQPNTADVGLEELGILDPRGFVTTDAHGRTSVDGVWAVGDVRPTLALAHAAFAEGFVVADVIAGVENVTPVDHLQVPRVTFSHPEVASVGLTEPQARARFGSDGLTVTTTSLKGNARALIAGAEGFVKIVARSGVDGETLGVHAVGPHATDLIGQASLVTEWGALPSEVAAITHAHPTLYEVLGEAFLAASGLAFHGH